MQIVYPLNASKWITQAEERFYPGLGDNGETFWFDYIDIGHFGLKYVPESNDVYQYQNGKFTVSDETIQGHDGGYYYGATVQPKEFTLRCLLEEVFFTNGLLSQINNYFKKGKTGRLQFRSRPWIWYAATVTDNPTYEIYAGRNMLITFHLTAYYPYARSDYRTIDDAVADMLTMYSSQVVNNKFYNELRDNTAFLPAIITPSTLLMTSINLTGATLSDPATFLCFDPGVMTSKSVILLQGNIGAGIHIYNESNDTHAHFVNLNTTAGSLSGATLASDGMNGKTIFYRTTGGIKKQLSTSAYMYHQKGFIELLPGYPVIRDFMIRSTGSNNKVAYCLIPFSNDNEFNPDYVYLAKSVGKYICITSDGNGTQTAGANYRQWERIKSVSINVLQPGTTAYTNMFGSMVTNNIPYYLLTITAVNALFTSSEIKFYKGTVANMNTIHVYQDNPTETATINKLSIKSYPTFG